MHTEAFTQRSLYTEELLHTKAFTHTGAFTQRSLYTKELFTHRRFYTEKSLLYSFCTQTSRSLYTQKLLHKEVFTQIYSFHTQTRLHAEAFTQRSLYTLHRELLDTEAFTHSEIFTQTFHTETLSHTEAFTQRSLYTKCFLHTETFTHKSFYTEKSLHRGTFTRSNKLKLLAVLREKPLAGAFGNSLAPQKSRLFPTEFLFHDLFSKNIRNIFLKQVPIQKLSSPHCDEMEGREIRRSRRGASALKYVQCMVMWCNNMWHKNYSVLRKVTHQPRHTNVQVLLTGKYPRQVFGLATSETLKKGRPELWVSSTKLTKPHMVQVGGERRAKKLRMFETWKLQVFHHLPTKAYSTHHVCSIVSRAQTRPTVCTCVHVCMYVYTCVYIYIHCIHIIIL